MGLFDSVWADCPGCGKERALEFQSKAGDCFLWSYDTLEVPAAIAADISGDEETCPNCRKRWAVRAPMEDYVSVRIVPSRVK
jgi:predicted  nucleic acid-binding Zn ribbon protein